MQPDRAGAPETICPCCRRPLTPTKAIREAILAEVQGWDYRFERAETVADAILDLMFQSQQSDPVDS